MAVAVGTAAIATVLLEDSLNNSESLRRDDRLMFPVANSDTRLNDKDQIIAVKLGEIAKAYPISEIQRAPNGVVRDTIDGQTIVLESNAQTDSARVVQMPANAFVAHTFWFAWVAFEPDTEVYRIR